MLVNSGPCVTSTPQDLVEVLGADVVVRGECRCRCSRREPGEIPVETVRVARAAFRKGSLAIRIRDELGVLFTDNWFGD